MPAPRRTIGVAIPGYIVHLPKLPRLLDSIATQTRPPDAVVVSASNCTDADAAPLLSRGWPFPLRIICHADRRNAAQNRNIAARALDTEIISFCDADDVMHPQRLEILADVFARTGAEFVLHGFIAPPSPAFDAPFRLYDRPWPCALNPPGLTLDAYIAASHPPQFGHVSVTRELAARHQFPENLSFERREDAEFVGGLLAQPHIRSAHIELGLTKYACAGSWVGAPEGSGVYALGGTARFGRSIGALPGVRGTKLFGLLQSTWRALPVSVRSRFLK
jgi:glycosyltransferase involved in cell wall biosynthesis